MTRTFDSNVQILNQLFSNQRYTGIGRALTSRLDSAGNPEPDPSTDLPAGYIWVRREGGRASTRALIGSGLRGWERIANLPVDVGINHGGELVAIQPSNDTETTLSYGNALSTAPAQAIYIEGKQFTPGLITANVVGGYGLTVYVQPIPHGDKVITGTVDVSASVPSGSGERRLAVVAYDVSDDELVVIDGTATTSLAPFTIYDFVAIPLGDTDRIRLGAVELTNGQTTILPTNFFIQDRDFLSVPSSDSVSYDAIMTDANFDAMVDALGNVMAGV